MAICTPYIPDNNVGKISPVTSTARPTGGDLYAGRTIYETDTNRMLQYDGTGWVILAEPSQSFTMSVSAGSGTFTLLGDQAFTYNRHDGWLTWEAQIEITTNGSAGSYVITSLPVAPLIANMHLGNGKERVAGLHLMTVHAFVGASALILKYDGSYPGGSGNSLWMSGSYPMLSRYS